MAGQYVCGPLNLKFVLCDAYRPLIRYIVGLHVGMTAKVYVDDINAGLSLCVSRSGCSVLLQRGGVSSGR